MILQNILLSNYSLFLLTYVKVFGVFTLHQIQSGGYLFYLKCVLRVGTGMHRTDDNTCLLHWLSFVRNYFILHVVSLTVS
jgi:hypothetical protein